MSHSITSRKELLMCSLQTFFNNPINIINIIAVINNNRKISLRVIAGVFMGRKRRHGLTCKKPIRIENGKLEVGHFAIRSGWKTAQDAAGLRLRQLIIAVLGQ